MVAAVWLCVMGFFAMAGRDGLAQDGIVESKAVQGEAIQNKGAAGELQQDEAPQDKGIRTLHVYANLIQLPVLVLGPAREPIAPGRSDDGAFGPVGCAGGGEAAGHE
jgi:hypothetical protein